MTRKHSDGAEFNAGLGPLFQPKKRALYSPDDPQTSRDAAQAAHAFIGIDQRILLNYVTRFPGCTIPELAWHAVQDHESGNVEMWRQKLGRRANEVEKAGLIRREGVRDGCSTWWPKEGGPNGNQGA
jgi:hypothetical protein